MATSAGTKVTDYQNAVPESVGVVTSDSLAAESLKGSGSFGKDNPHAAASKQPSHSTTTNTTDTSNARTLPPAHNSEARDAQQGGTADQELNSGVGHGKDIGRGPTYNVDTSSTSKSSQGNGGTVAGGYAGADHQALNPGVQRPKGANLTETQDLDGKTAFPEVGTEQDPGRLKEQDLQQRTARPGVDASSTQSGLQQGDSKFSSLGDETA